MRQDQRAGVETAVIAAALVHDRFVGGGAVSGVEPDARERLVVTGDQIGVAEPLQHALFIVAAVSVIHICGA